MKVLLLTTILLVAVVVTSCKVEPGSNSVGNQTTPSPTPSTQQNVTTTQLTLPLLDALLANESFVTQLKSKLMLTDDQINALKKAAANEVDRLRTSNAEEGLGNATEARSRANDQLSTIIGRENLGRLDALARDFWAKGGDETVTNEGKEAAELSKIPNAVPTDTRIVINAPAYRMDLFQDGSLVKSYKIGIGYPEFPLPQGLREAKSIIFNPTWTPPDSPWVANMKRVSPGEEIAAGSELNPLGPVKIPIGLPSLIHGGKSPAKLGEFASHGCVGLTTPQVKDFAQLLAEVSGTDLSDKTIKSYFADKTHTKVVKLNQAVPVELRYETIVVEDGKLHIYKDVYDQNTNTEENLRAVLEANGSHYEDLSADEKAKVLDALNAMSAHPKPVSSDVPDLSPTPDSSNANKNRGVDRKVKSSKTKPEKQKEIVIEISALSGKGYPAPVDLDDGKGKPAERSIAAATTPSKRR